MSDPSFSGNAPASSSGAAPSGARPMRFSSSHMESSVTRLLVATKMLLESLAKWATGACSEEHVSDIYVRLGNDFNAARLAFGSYGISMAELESVPDDLRTCLEACLSEDASQAALDRHLPQVRQIVVGLLQGLKAKQALYKEYLLASRQVRHEEPSSSSSSGPPLSGSHRSTSLSSQTDRSHRGSVRNSNRLGMSIPPSLVSSVSSAPLAPATSSSTLPSDEVQAARRESYQLLEQRSSIGPSGSGDYSRRGPMGPRAPRDSRTYSQTLPQPQHVPLPPPPPETPERYALNDDAGPSYPFPAGISPPGRDKVLPRLPPSGNETPIRHVPASLPSTSSRRPQHTTSLSASHSVRNRSPLPTIEADTPMSFARSSFEEDDGSDPSLRALKSRDALERRASKRFSAYTLNKMGISPSGFNAGLAQMSPTPKRSTRSMHSPRKDPSAEEEVPTLPPIPGTIPPPTFARGPKSTKRQSVSNKGTGVSPVTPRALEPMIEAPQDAAPQVSLDVQRPATAVEGSSTSSSTTEDATNSHQTEQPDGGAVALLPTSSAAAPADTPTIPQSSSSATAAEVETTPKTPTTDDGPRTLDIFVQLGRLTKKSTLTIDSDSPLTIMRLRMLFVDRFGYSPGQDDFPAIYIKDLPTGVEYELEDLNDIHSGTLLSLNIDSLDQVRQHLDVSLGTLTRELRELKIAFNEQKDRSSEAPTQQQIQDLVAHLGTNGTVPSAVAAPASGTIAGGPSSGTDTSGRDKISEEEFAAAGQRVALLARSASKASRPGRKLNGDGEKEQGDAPAAEPADTSVSTSAAAAAAAATGAEPESELGSQSLVLSGTAMAEDLQRQYEAVQRLRQEMAIMKQVQYEFNGDVGGLLRDLREQNKRVRALVSQDAPVQRSFIEAGKTQVDTQSQEVLTLVEDLQDTVDELKMDVIQRKVTPRPQALKKIHGDIEAATSGLEQLERYVQSVKPAWKKTWEQELKVIVEEQEFLRHQEGLIMDLRDDQSALQDVFEQIQKVLRLRGAAQRQVSGQKDGFPALRPVGFVPPPPDEEHKGLSTVVLEVRGQPVDHGRRLRALQAAERAWAKERSEKEKDEFAQELAGFVDLKSLRRTGGHLETDRVRQKRDEATRLAMFSGDAGQVGGAPVNVGPIVKPRRLIWGKDRTVSPSSMPGQIQRSLSTSGSVADTSNTAAAAESPLAPASLAPHLQLDPLHDAEPVSQPTHTDSPAQPTPDPSTEG